MPLDKRQTTFLISTLLLFAFLAVVLIAIVVYNVLDIVRIIRAWIKNRSYRQAVLQTQRRLMSVLDDDEQYPDRNTENVVKDGEYAKYTQVLDDVRAKYQHYNTQVKERSERTQQMPEDQVDATLLSKDHDDYTYAMKDA
jgi:hypothetical protein